jgi:hypothetical protein
MDRQVELVESVFVRDVLDDLVAPQVGGLRMSGDKRLQVSSEPSVLETPVDRSVLAASVIARRRVCKGHGVPLGCKGRNGGDWRQALLLQLAKRRYGAAGRTPSRYAGDRPDINNFTQIVLSMVNG